MRIKPFISYKYSNWKSITYRKKKNVYKTLVISHKANFSDIN